MDSNLYMKNTEGTMKNLNYEHSQTGAAAPAPAKPRPPAKRRRGLPIFTREGATQEQW